MSCERFSLKGIDIGKILFALVVVQIHTNPFVTAAGETWSFFSIFLNGAAVPFFMMSSGYLLGLKYFKAPNTGYILKSAAKLLKLYVLWGLFYTVLTFSEGAIKSGFGKIGGG